MQLPRKINLTGFLLCISLLGFALFEQYHSHLEPCPLCIFQRVAFIFLGIFFLAAGLHGPRRWGRYIYAFLIFLAATAGALVAGRHIWIQHLPPDQVPGCGPGLNYLLQTFPLKDVLSMVFKGSGECAIVNWTFLGLSIPGWALVWFVTLGIVGVIANLRQLAPNQPL